MLLCTLLCAALFSCATSPKPKLHPVYITDSKAVELLPLSACSVSVDSIQEFDGAFDGKSFSLMAYLKLDASGIAVTLLNSFGVDVGSLCYDGDSVKFESAFFPESFKAEYIVADFQNAYYDFAKLKSHYGESGLLFTEEQNANTVTRTICDGKNLIEEISIAKSGKKITRIKIKNHLRNYTYVITEVGS